MNVTPSSLEDGISNLSVKTSSDVTQTDSVPKSVYSSQVLKDYINLDADDELHFYIYNKFLIHELFD